MKRIRLKRPSPAMVVALLALAVMALTGTAVAAKKLGLGALSSGAKNKTVGVGKLTYASTTVSVPTSPGTTVTPVSATCPGGTKPLDGGVKITPSGNVSADYIEDYYVTGSGFTAHVDVNNATAALVVVTVACAPSNSVTGTPPAS